MYSSYVQIDFFNTLMLDKKMFGYVIVVDGSLCPTNELEIRSCIFYVRKSIQW
jgi:hypothetical protein